MTTESSNVTVRLGRAPDSALLAELGARTFSDAFAADNTPANMASYLAASFGPQKQAAEVADPLTTFLIAEVDRTAVGYARLREGPSPAAVGGARPIEIVRFYSAREWIGRGVGAKLMPACLDHAKSKGCDAIWLDVWERNPRARAFYRKWGFAEVGAQPFQLGDEAQNDIVMWRAL